MWGVTMPELLTEELELPWLLRRQADDLEEWQRGLIPENEADPGETAWARRALRDNASPELIRAPADRIAAAPESVRVMDVEPQYRVILGDADGKPLGAFTVTQSGVSPEQLGSQGTEPNPGPS